MATKIRHCIACGREYSYCPHNMVDESKPYWMFAWDTEECKVIFNTVSKYCGKELDKEQAKDIIDKVYSHTITFNPTIEEKLKEIYEKPKTVRKRTVKKKADDTGKAAEVITIVNED